MEKKRETIKKFMFILMGTFIYSVGINFFIASEGLFSGGCVGLAQLIAAFLPDISLGFLNTYAIMFFILNLPLFVLAYRCGGKRFLVRTLLGAGGTTLFGALLPIPATPILTEKLASALIGGIVSGAGTGLMLMGGGCGGGMDIVGVWATKKYKWATVGKISLMFNALLYAVLFFIYDAPTAIYSIICTGCFSLALDKVHFQNINVRMTIFTKLSGIDHKINEQTGRGVTEWEGVGAYTGEKTHVLVTCINKYEEHEFVEIVKSIDPKAFIVVDENVYVSGNFEKRV